MPAADVAEIVRQFPSFIAVYEGAELRCVLANELARAIVGGRPFEGLPLRQALPEFEAQQIVDLVERVFATGQPERADEWRVQIADPAGGEAVEVFANFDAVPWRRPDGSLRGVITTGNVVTDMVLARRAAAVRIETAEREYRRAQADVAELQRALLPVNLPLSPNAEVVAFYLVAGQQQAAGGDWFDCIALPGNRMALVVGDVVGHGIEASAAMAQLRAVLSELLSSGSELSDALHRLDVFAGRSASFRGATLCVVVADLDNGALSYATLGHPAPLLVTADGSARFLAGSGGRPLDAGRGDIAVAEDELAADEALLLFSDGLVERPGQSFDDGLRELARVAGDAAAGRVLPGGAPTGLAHRVATLSVEVLTRTGTTDDVTVLGLQRRPTGAPLALSISTPAELSLMRAELGRWLAGLGVAPAEIADLQLVATEAMSNGLEHAYGGRPGAVDLSAELDTAGQVRCAVSDAGRWRDTEVPPDERGRGLALIRHLSADLRIDTTSSGTTVRFKVPVHGKATLISALPPPAVTVDEPPFSAEVCFEPSPTVHVRGVVDMTSADSLAAAIGRASRGGIHPVIVDLTGVQQLASAGVRELMTAARPPAALTIHARRGSSPDSVLTLVGLHHLVAEDGS